MVRERLPYLIGNGIQLTNNLRVPKPHDPETLGFKPLGPLRVGRCRGGVLATVDLNNQAGLETDEVNDVGANWNLPAKAKSVHLLAPQS